MTTEPLPRSAAAVEHGPALARLALTAALAMPLSGCAFDPGDPFGRASVSLFGSHEEPSARSTTGGFQQLDTDFQIRIDELELLVDSVEILATDATATAASFDPANPPEGYGTCHGGHCHAADGSLVSYEDIAAELAQSTGGGLSVALAMEGGWLDLRVPSTLALSCAEGCVLGEGNLASARVTVSRLHVEGLVRDGRVEPRIAGTVDWQANVRLLVTEPSEGDDAHADEHGSSSTSGVLEAALAIAVDEDKPPLIEIALHVATDTSLFDGIAFDEPLAEPDGTIDLSVPTAVALREQLRANFAELVLDVWTSRSDP